MSDPFLSLSKVVTTLKFNMLGEVCRVRFIDGIHLKVDSQRFGFRSLGLVTAMDERTITLRCVSLDEVLKKAKGLEIEVSFSHEGEPYFFNTIIMDSKDQDTLVLSRPLQINKTQRREYLRMPIKVPIRISSIDNRELGAVFHAQFADQVITKDISGGGLRLESADMVEQTDGIQVLLDKTIEKNSIVEMEIGLPEENRTVKALGKVSWINKVDEKYEVGITYLNILKRDQDYIVRYILNEEIKRSKHKDLKELGKR
jgi:c-di-GMP-binding flagellar brake protein YcgR